MTLVTSLNGLVYWLAYDKKVCTPPTVSGAGHPVMTHMQPMTATAA